MKRRHDNSMAPFRTVTMTTLRTENERLTDCLNDCIALLLGQVSGPSQRDGVIREAITCLGDRYSGPCAESVDLSNAGWAHQGKSNG